MISYETKYGRVEVSNNFFAKLIGYAVTSCYGVAGMMPKGPQIITDLIKGGKSLDKGIKVYGDINNLYVDLHIIVTYGININAIASSIVHNVKYRVNEATRIDIKKVIVHIDGMKNE